MLKHLVLYHKCMGEIGGKRDEVKKNIRAIIRMKYITILK